MEPEELRNWTFTRSRRGYDSDEVDVVLEAASVALTQARAGGSPAATDALDQARTEIDVLRANLDALRRQQGEDQQRTDQRHAELARELAEAIEARDRAVSEAVEAGRLQSEAEARAIAADGRLASTGRNDEELREQLDVALGDLRIAQQRIAELEDQVADLEAAASAAVTEEVSPWEAVADRVTGVLRAADEDAARIVLEAQHAADAARAEADGYAARVREEADASAASVEDEADAYARRVRTEADEASAIVAREASATRTEAEQVLDEARRHAREVVIEAEANAAVRRSAAATATRELIERSSDRYRVLAAVAQASWVDLGRRLDEVSAVVDDARSQLGARIDLRLDPAEILDELDAPDHRAGRGAGAEDDPDDGSDGSGTVEQDRLAVP